MSYCHITERERYVISHLHISGVSLREIGRRLERSHTTIAREIKRNKAPYSRYWYSYTHSTAEARKHIPRHYKCQSNKRLMRYLQRKLAQQWSPEEITGRIKQDYPEDESMRISHDGLYKLIYRNASQGGDLYNQLRRRRKRRRKQAGYGSERGLIVDRKRITERPRCVDLKNRYGDWEGDTVIGAQGTGAILTQIERKSRYLITAKLLDKQAELLADASIRLFKNVKAKLKQTLTVDNGKEFAAFKKIEAATNIEIYFADPYSSWQRGCNENANGLLRQYFPKGTDFTTITAKALAQATRRINNRPRKCLNYRTPSEVFWAASNGALAS
jgi:transposase, IS30 family